MYVIAKLLMEIAGAPVQDLTLNALDLFSGPGVLWKSWHKLLKYVKDRTNEDIDAGSDDGTVPIVCVVGKVVGIVLDWGRVTGVESKGRTVDGGGSGWVEVGGGTGTGMELEGSRGGGTELEVGGGGGGTWVEVGVGGTYEEVGVESMGATVTMKYLTLSSDLNKQWKNSPHLAQ
jgi:hypothetical protein